MSQVRDLPVEGAVERGTGRIGRLETCLAGGLLGIVFLLRILYAFHYRLDSDEPQHLHVAWGWAHGFLQYRDVFDNHSPLFHMLCGPLVAALGDRADLIVWMRLAMLPTFAAALVSVYWIGRAIFGRQVGLWAAVWLAGLRHFFINSAEFRADDLWMALWLAAMAVLVQPRLTVKRSLAAGLLVGAALAASMKTGLFMPFLVLAAGMAVLIAGREARWREWAAKAGRCAAAGAIGMVVVPGVIVAYFAWRGALAALQYGTIEHNSVVGLGSPFENWVIVPRALVIGVIGVWGALRTGATPSLTARRLFVALLASILLGSLAFWPMREPQSYLPVYPLAVVAVVGAVDKVLSIAFRFGPAKRSQRLQQQIWLATMAGAMVVQTVMLMVKVPWHTQMAVPMRMWRDVLRLTDADQKVFDLKGELLLRPRGYYYMLESVTALRFSRGLIADDIPEHLIANKVCVTSLTGLASDMLPPRADRFLRKNYVLVGLLQVAGKWLDKDSRPAATSQSGERVLGFTVAIPARYVILAGEKQAGGVLDGQPYDGPRELAAGRHEYRPAAGEKDLVLVWAQAVERGFRPVESLPMEWLSGAP